MVDQATQDFSIPALYQMFPKKKRKEKLNFSNRSVGFEKDLKPWERSWCSNSELDSEKTRM